MAERELQGAVVAVVGASGGLGSAVCADLTARGATVVACGPHPERIAAAGVAAASVVELDLRDPSAGDALVAAVADLGGRLDGLVNSAGVVAFGDLVDTDDDVIEELFLTDVVGPLWLLKRVVPLLAESKGFVVQLSAVVAEQPMAGMAAYSSAKAALTAADTALTRELRRKGITVCDVRPPHTETGLAGRPIAGEAPRLKEGLSPSTVATAVVDAIAAGATEVPAATFTA
jgi:NAD(P)-dependent dehydrogenase (short-subunit alcohol dehydrogenase family)